MPADVILSRMMTSSRSSSERIAQSYSARMALILSLQAFTLLFGVGAFFIASSKLCGPLTRLESLLCQIASISFGNGLQDLPLPACGIQRRRVIVGTRNSFRAARPHVRRGLRCWATRTPLPGALHRIWRDASLVCAWLCCWRRFRSLSPGLRSYLPERPCGRPAISNSSWEPGLIPALDEISIQCRDTYAPFCVCYSSSLTLLGVSIHTAPGCQIVPSGRTRNLLRRLPDVFRFLRWCQVR